MSLARESTAKIRAQYDALLLQAPVLIQLPLIDNEAISKVFARQMEGLARILNQSSYAELQTALTHASELRDVLSRYTRLSNAESELLVAAEKNRRATRQLAAEEKALRDFPKVSLYPILGILATTVGLFYGAILADASRDEALSSILLCIGLFGIPLFVIGWILSRQPRKTLMETRTKEAREVAEATKELFASAISERDSAAHEATIPAWPVTP